MGRKVVDATKAWRMRRTRGDIGRFLLFAAADRVTAVLGFLPDLAAGGGDFGCADLEVERVVAADSPCEGFAGAGATAGLSEESEPCWEKAGAFRSPLDMLSASNQHHLRPTRTTFIFRAERECPNS